MASKPIFISHAEKDKALASALTDLLTQNGVKPEDIFCSSLEGTGIPSGANFIDFVKQQLEEPKLVILLLSSHYYESIFCVAELGASWAMAHRAFPILIPPLSYEDMKAVIRSDQARKIDDKHAYNELKDVIEEVLSIKINSARWENKRDVFLAALPELLKKSGDPSKVPFAKHVALERDYGEAKKLIAEQEKLIEGLKKAKDATDVKRIVEEHSGESERFKKLCDDVLWKITKLPSVVGEMLFYEYSNHDADFSDHDFANLRLAAQNGYVEQDRDGNYSLNRQDPTVRRTMQAIDAVASALGEASEAFCESFIDTHDFGPDIKNRRFWKECFELR